MSLWGNVAHIFVSFVDYELYSGIGICAVKHI